MAKLDKQQLAEPSEEAANVMTDTPQAAQESPPKELAPKPPQGTKFSMAQLLNSTRYAHQRDILSALLEDGRSYSHAEVAGLVQKFMESKVK